MCSSVIAICYYYIRVKVQLMNGCPWYDICSLKLFIIVLTIIMFILTAFANPQNVCKINHVHNVVTLYHKKTYVIMHLSSAQLLQD